MLGSLKDQAKNAVAYASGTAVSASGTGIDASASASEASAKIIRSTRSNQEIKNPEKRVIEKGSLVLFQHGLLGSSASFDATANELQNHSSFINAGIITKRDEKRKGQVVLKITNLEFIKILGKNGIKLEADNCIVIDEKSSQILKRVSNEYMAKGFNIMFFTEFSNSVDSHSNQIEELEKFVSSVNPSNNKVVLIGHSKGGLISIGYAASNPQNVKKIVTVGTPYEPNIVAKSAGGVLNWVHKMLGYKTNDIDGFSDLAGWTDALASIRNTWNTNPLCRDIDANAIGCDISFGDNKDKSDGVVSVPSQLGGIGDKRFIGIKPHLISILHDTTRNLCHTSELANSAVIKKMRNIVLGDWEYVKEFKIIRTFRNLHEEKSLEDMPNADIKKIINQLSVIVENSEEKNDLIDKLNNEISKMPYAITNISDILFYSIEKNLFISVERILKELSYRPDIAKKVLSATSGPEGFTPLHLAIINGCDEIADLLIKNEHVDITLKTTDSCNALHIAVLTGRLSVIGSLIKRLRSVLKTEEEFKSSLSEYINEQSKPLDKSSPEFTALDIANVLYKKLETLDVTKDPETAKDILVLMFYVNEQDVNDLQKAKETLMHKFGEIIKLLENNYAIKSKNISLGSETVEKIFNYGVTKLFETTIEGKLDPSHVKLASGLSQAAAGATTVYSAFHIPEVLTASKASCEGAYNIIKGVVKSRDAARQVITDVRNTPVGRHTVESL